MTNLQSFYNDILDSDFKYNLNNNKNWIYSSIGWNYFIHFIKNRNLDTGDKTLIISLSGGVDSMVFLYICKVYNTINNKFKFRAVHINWNQRKDSIRESEFLEKYTKENDILYHFLNINDLSREINRETFEKTSRQIRFDLYKKLINEYNGDSVFLGHHSGDIIENVFTNIIHGSHFIDLGKMTTESIINDVLIVRPFLSINKSDIYEIAMNLNIPFFKDSTPLWSNRGAIRNKIFPEIEKQFGKRFETGLLNTANKSKELGEMIQICLIEPYLKKTIKISDNSIIMPFEKTYPISFYEIIFEKIMHSLNKSKIRNKTIKSWYNYISYTSNWKKYSLGKTYSIKLDSNPSLMIFEF
jgi:tRNA(Ile)-lysidine synthetase-like protein